MISLCDEINVGSNCFLDDDDGDNHIAYNCNLATDIMEQVPDEWEGYIVAPLGNIPVEQNESNRVQGVTVQLLGQQSEYIHNFDENSRKETNIHVLTVYTVIIKIKMRVTMWFLFHDPMLIIKINGCIVAIIEAHDTDFNLILNTDNG